MDDGSRTSISLGYDGLYSKSFGLDVTSFQLRYRSRKRLCNHESLEPRSTFNSNSTQVCSLIWQFVKPRKRLAIQRSRRTKSSWSLIIQFAKSASKLQWVVFEFLFAVIDAIEWCWVQEKSRMEEEHPFWSKPSRSLIIQHQQPKSKPLS